MRRPGPLDPAAAVYLVVVPLVVAHLALLDDPSRTLRGGAPYLAAAVAVLAVRAIGLRLHRRTDVWINSVALFAGALALWAIVAFLVALPGGLDDPSGFYTVKVQVRTPLGDHNTVAGLLLPGLAAAAVATSRDRRWLSVLATITLGLVATLSRGAAVVLLAAVVVTWPVVGDGGARLRLLAAGAFSLVAIVAVAAFLGAAPTEGAPEPEGPVGPSIVARADLVVRGFEVGADNPVRGGGLRRYQDHAADLVPPNHHAHNLVAHAFAEGGVPLATVAVGLPLLLAVRLRRTAAGPLRDVLVVGAVALVLHAQHDIMGGLAGYEVLLAVLVGVSGVVRHPRSDAP